jgi:hypothetical protein
MAAARCKDCFLGGFVHALSILGRLTWLRTSSETPASRLETANGGHRADESASRLLKESASRQRLLTPLGISRRRLRLPPDCTALHRFLTVCIGCNPCRPYATYVHVGCGTPATRVVSLELKFTLS